MLKTQMMSFINTNCKGWVMENAKTNEDLQRSLIYLYQKQEEAPEAMVPILKKIAVFSDNVKNSAEQIKDLEKRIADIGVMYNQDIGSIKALTTLCEEMITPEQIEEFSKKLDSINISTVKSGEKVEEKVGEERFTMAGTAEK